MTRFVYLCAGIMLAGAAFSQSDEATPAFEIADVHVSTISPTQMYLRDPVMRGGRYEVRGATMVDLLSIAYDVTEDKILGGPSWLEMNHYDIIAKAPPHATVESSKVALRKLLVDRFKLVAHTDSKPQPTYALVVSKKPLLKEADGKEPAGCKPQSGSPGQGGGVLMMVGADGNPQQFTLGPGNTVQYQCRNMTMEAFVAGLSDMFGTNLGNNPLLNETKLEGHWNFDVKWSLGIGRAVDVDRITVFDAMEKQLGLKLEPRQMPQSVVVVESVNEKPTGNVPDIADRLKIPPPPTEFDVAALKATAPDGRMIFRGGQVQPGGRVTIQNQNVKSLIMAAWNLRPDMIIGAPSWMDSDQYDILAKVSSSEELDMDQVWPLVRKLVTERFQMTVHMEERSVNAYTLTALKPKMKKADPATRAHIQNGVPQNGKDPRAPGTMRTRLIMCQNVTMEQFAGRLQSLAGGYFQSPVLNETALEGGWDFTLNFSPAGRAGVGRAVARGGGDGGGGGGAGAAAADVADPGDAISLFDAVEKQLGLKLELQKRPVSVLVIDKAERKPIDN
jgi:uncharacterized protein (TIGR03435 family)